MSSLSGAWLAVALIQLVAWIGACLLGAGLGRLPRPTRSALIALLALVAFAAAVTALSIAVSLVAVDWAWGAEKVVVAAPIGVVGSLAAGSVVLRDALHARRGTPAPSWLFGALISAALGALVGPLAILLIGSDVTWPAVLAVALAWTSGSAVALFATSGRPRRVIVSTAAFAALAVVLLALFTVFGPTVGSAVAGGGHHLPAADGGTGSAATVSVADLRETGQGTTVHRFGLEARHQTIPLPDGSEYDAVTFGSVPGPELVVTQGELVEVTLTNRDVAAGVTLHWHGYDVPAGDDGVAGVTQDAVAPGESFVYRFVADQVGTYWYHTHQDALEGIVRGLYGALVVVPAPATGQTDAGPAIPDVTALIHTLSGETLVGADAVLRVPGAASVRLRLVNTDQAPRRVVLDADVHLVALDGTDLGRPALIAAGTSLRIPAGGRADLLVAADGASLRIERGGDSGIVLGGTGAPAELDFGGPEFDVLDAASGAMPEWASGPYDVEAAQVLDRLLRVVDGLPRLADTINSAAFPYIQPIVVDEGDRVLVTIVNRSSETHPMHLHGHHMLVVSRNGQPAEGALWLDTVDVRPGETWQVAFLADNPGLWMDHCHNLDHAAAGMVMHLAYRGVTSPFELDGAHGNSPE
ncbi:MAG TPA: multicopper oxidase family protein [Pseudolysinimonas sp.]|nr:multicopper oxidase family protein [Pseudolysinimonas sp.]